MKKLLSERRPSAVVLVICLAAAAAVLAQDVVSSQSRPGRARRTVMLDGREVADGEVIVRYRTGSGPFEQQRAELDTDADEVEAIGRRGARRIRSRRLGTRALLQALRANPDVDFVEPNYVVSAGLTPNDSGFQSLWGLFNTGQLFGSSFGVIGADISATEAWDITTGGRNTVVGVIDTGIDYNHFDLAGNMWTAPRAFTVTIGGVPITCGAGTHGFNAITNNCNPMDDQYHGTHVAGTIGAVGNNGTGVAGVNWTASMMALKFLDSSGSGYTSDAIKAIEFAIQAKAVLGMDANVRVLSNSWGGGGSSIALRNQIEAANSSDMLFVAAAGNSASNNDVWPFYPSSYATTNLLSVAATTNTDSLAWFSNWGAGSVHLGAPGASIVSTMPGGSFGTLSGTSMATPHVSGAAALLLSACNLTTAQLKAALLAAVDPLPALSGRTASGGRLNVNTALRGCPPPTLTPAALTVSRGSSMSFTLAGGPANARDWIGLFCPTAAGDQSFVDWKYLNGSRFASPTGLSTATVTFAAPATAAAACNARFFINDGFSKLATSATVVFTNAVPTLTSLAPGALPVGSSATLAVGGTNFMAGSLVQVNGVARATTFVSATQLTAPIVPADVAVAGASLSITVLSPAPGGGVSNALALTVTASPATLTPTTPTVARSGATVPFAVAGGTGNAFDWVGWYCPATGNDTAYSDWKYLTNSRVAPAVGLSAATITFTAPATATTCNARLFASNGYIKLVTGPTVLIIENPPPTITSLTPGSVGAGVAATVTVTGTNFLPASVVNVNGQPRTTTFVSATQLTAAVLASDVPTAGGSASITVVNSASIGGTSNAVMLNVSAAPTLTSIYSLVAPTTTVPFMVSNAPGNPTDWVGWYCPSADADAAYIDWKYLSDTRTPPAPGTTSATVTFTVPAGGGGACQARLFANNGFTKLASVAVSAYDMDGITLTLTPAVAPGGTFTVNAILGSPIPTRTRDWVALFCPAANGDMAYVDWNYMNNAKTAPATAWSSPAMVTFTAPATIGTKCNARLFRDNGFDKLMTTWPATVTAPALTVASRSVSVGGPMSVAIAAGPANPRDWVGLYCPATNGDLVFTEWKYLNGTRTAPASGVASATLTFQPPSAGTCDFRLFANDAFTRLAISETFAVQ